MHKLKNVKDSEHLLPILTNRIDDYPCFALFLGAGASYSSGIKTAEDLIEQWRRELYYRSDPSQDFEKWLSSQKWAYSEDEYAILFENIYDEPAQRRDFVESLLKDASPIWGYAYLASLLKARYFNVVFTSNFDDLINEACWLYSDGPHPIVCAHDSAIAGIRVSPTRPKIIKLHGDFLFNNIKNTTGETSTLPKNMEDKFCQFAQEYGLVVIGYSGRDQSVMSLLGDLLNNDQNFKHGIYWCVRRDARMSKRLKDLLKKPRVHLVEIQGFDEFMAAFHEKAELGLPKPVSNPLGAAAERAKLFCTLPDSLEGNAIISRDKRKILDALSKMRTAPDASTKDIEALPQQLEEIGRKMIDAMPDLLKAAIENETLGPDSALPYFKSAVEENPDDSTLAVIYAECLASAKKRVDLKEFIPYSALSDTNKTYYLLHARDYEGAISLADKILAVEPSDHIARINRAIALKRINRLGEMEAELTTIEGQNPGEFILFGIKALRNEKGELLKLLRSLLDKGRLSVDQLEMFVVFDDYRNDADFLRLISDYRKPHKDKE